MNLQIIAVPYDSGHRATRMGRGPEHLLAHGLADALAARGREVAVTILRAHGAFPTEIGTAFELQRLVAERVRAALAERRFPIVLAGNCNVAVGVLAGVGGEAGVVWFDAHGDFNTPETTTSGFLDGMALATVTGRCWGALSARVAGFDPVPESCVILAGARELDRLEAELLAASHVAHVPAEAIRLNGARVALEAAVRRLRGLVPRVYLHIDLDVLDPAEARANDFSPPDGLSVVHLLDAVRLVGELGGVAAGSLTAFDPAADHGGGALRASLRVLETMAEAAG